MAVGYDTHVTTAASSGTTIDCTLTVASNSNRLAVMIITMTQNSPSVSGVAYTSGSGGTWTLLGTHVGGVRMTSIWYSTAPSTGSITARATLATIDLGGAATLYSLYDCDQTTPMDGYVSGGVTNDLTLTSAVGDLGLFGGVFATSPGTITPGTTDYSATPYDFARVQRASGASSIVFDYNDGISRSVSAGNVNAAAAASIHYQRVIGGGGNRVIGGI